MINLGLSDHHSWNFQGFLASVLSGFLSIVDRTVHHHPLSDSVIFNWPLDLWLNKPVHSYIYFCLPWFISVVPVYIFPNLVPTLFVEIFKMIGWFPCDSPMYSALKTQCSLRTSSLLVHSGFFRVLVYSYLSH